MKKYSTLILVLFLSTLSSLAQQPCGFWYVSPNGTGTAGTPDEPVTLSYALNNFTPARNYIKMLAGNYAFSNKLILPSDVTIEGGYIIDGTDWVLTSDSATILDIDPVQELQIVNSTNVGHHIGIEAANISDFTLRNLTVNVQMAGASGTVDGRGISIYGIYLNGSTGYEISRVTVNTGAASNGDDGDAVPGSGGAGGGGAGGNGGSGSDGCSNSSSGSSGLNGNGGANGGSGGSGRDPDCNGLGCDGDQRDGLDGGNGSNGSLGGPDWNPGDIAAPAPAIEAFYVPNAPEDGGDGTGGGGGGGGGGSTGGTCVCVNCGGNDGGDGGDAGDGGLGGNGAGGGGGAFAIYATGTGSGTIIDCALNPGSAGTGGIGTDGQLGTNGQSGQNGEGGGNCVCTSNPEGGDGGNGGDGGDGGRGRDGANGLQSEIVTANGANVTQTGTSVPNGFDPVLVNQFQGCTNSEIVISQNGGSLDLSSMGNPSFVNDLNPTSTSYTSSSSPASVYYTTTGVYDVLVNGEKYESFININSTRLLPNFTTTQNNSQTTVICENTELNFNTSFNGEEYEWSIVSGTTSSAPSGGVSSQSSSHVFTSTGTYYVKLRIKDECCGWSVPVYEEITVNPGATASIDNSFASDYCGSDTTTIQLAGTPSGGVFSGSGVTGNTFRPSDADFGEVVITYTVSVQGGCDGISFDTVQVDSVPDVEINGLDNSFCVNGLPGSVSATPSGGTLSGTGLVNDLLFIPSFAGVGSFDISYTYTEILSGCTIEVTETAVVNDTPVVVMDTIPDQCINGGITQLSGTPAGGTFNGQGVVTNLFYPTQAGVGGPYLLEYEYTDQNGCTNNSEPVFVEVFGQPSFSLGNDTTLCSQTSVALSIEEEFSSYSWSNGDQDSVTTISVAGTYTATVTDTNGCATTDTIVVNEGTAVVPDISANDTNVICQGETAILEADTGFVSYQWSDGNTMGLTLEVDQAGSYFVTVVDSNGCSGNSNTINVTVNALPEPEITTLDSVFCEGDSSLLFAGSNWQAYQWSNGDTAEYTYVNAQGGYTVTVADNNGCWGTSDTFDITVNTAPDPQITANGPTEFCAGGQVTLDAGSGYTSYDWLISNHNPSNTTSQTITVTYSDTFGVTVVDANGCEGSTSSFDEIVVTVWDPQPSISNSGDTLICNGSFSSYQWYYNGTAIPGATLSTYVATQSGAYKVQVTDINGCEGEAELGMFNPGFGESSIVELLSVYPNPNNGQVTMELGVQRPTEVIMSIVDITGRVITMERLKVNGTIKKQLNFQNLNPGIYLLQLEMEGEKLSRRLIRR